MKAKLIIGFIAIAVAALAGWNINKNQNEVILSELALANVEALAQEYESNIGRCSVYGCTWSFTTTCNVYTTNMHIFLMSCPNMRG